MGFSTFIEYISVAAIAMAIITLIFLVFAIWDTAGYRADGAIESITKMFKTSSIIEPAAHKNWDKWQMLKAQIDKLEQLTSELGALYIVEIRYINDSDCFNGNNYRSPGKHSFIVRENYADPKHLANERSLSDHIANMCMYANGQVNAGSQTLFIDKLLSINVRKVEQDDLQKELQETISKINKLTRELEHESYY